MTLFRNVFTPFVFIILYLFRKLIFIGVFFSGSGSLHGLQYLKITPEGSFVWYTSNPVRAKESRMRRKLILTAKKRGVNLADKNEIMSSVVRCVVSGLTLFAILILLQIV